MMKLFTTVALVALVATPVLAQTNNRAQQRARAEASQTTQVQQERHSANRTTDVYDVRGQRLGSDPDSAVRAQIANEPMYAGD